MAQIHETLGQTGTAAINQAKAISGLGGVGKTQTAIEYAYRYFYDQPTYEWMFWVNASDLSLAASFGSIATDLALPNHETQKLDEKIAAVSRWLETHDRWLLIFDNLDDPKSLKPFRPKNPRGRILITSRAQRFDSLGVAYPITLNPMTATEAHQFLRHRTERTTVDLPEQQAVEALAAALGYLPLALEQAAAYIVAKGVSFAAYLRSYEKRRLQLLEKQQPQTGNYPNSVATTWAINFEAVKTNSPAAADLLNLSAFLAPDNIPYELLAFGKDHMGELLSAALAEALEDELVISELLAELTRYSLIRLESDYRYSIHRMVQEVLRDGMDEATRLAWLGRAVEALNEVFPSGEFETWQQCARLVEHGQAIERHLEPIPYHTVSAARLLNNAGYYLHEQGRYAEAEPLFRKALSIYEQQLGENHPDVASSLNNLAELYRAQGRYAEAEPLFRKALSIYEQQLGENHPHVASSLNNLALLYDSQGRYAEAEPLFRKALSIGEQQLGENHPHVAQSLNNLAALYYSQGRYAEAESLFRKALSIGEQQLGEDHPHVAQSLNNLAELYRAQGRYPEAEPLYLRSLTVMLARLGQTHPDTQKVQQNFHNFLQQVIDAKQTAQLSDHPTTQAVLAELQQQS